mmetsp:Transcript_35330/g.69722  ORF Transcript_35330/g.69722 Transcript_35330/m.69722 type:complete len:112 (+) Transcript_35330:101-436(+)
MHPTDEVFTSRQCFFSQIVSGSATAASCFIRTYTKESVCVCVCVKERGRERGLVFAVLCFLPLATASRGALQYDVLPGDRETLLSLGPCVHLSVAVPVYLFVPYGCGCRIC